jgi:hypothetical protein
LEVEVIPPLFDGYRLPLLFDGSVFAEFIGEVGLAVFGGFL